MTEIKSDAESAQRSLSVQAIWSQCHPPQNWLRKREHKRQTLLSMEKIQERQTVLRGHLRERYMNYYMQLLYILIYILGPLAWN